MKIVFSVRIYDFEYEDMDTEECPKIKFSSFSDNEKSNLKERLQEIANEFVQFCIQEITPPEGYSYTSHDPFRKVIANISSENIRIKSKSITFYIKNKFGYSKNKIMDRVNSEVSDGFSALVLDGLMKIQNIYFGFK